MVSNTGKEISLDDLKVFISSLSRSKGNTAVLLHSPSDGEQVSSDSRPNS